MLDSLYLPVLMAQEQSTFSDGLFKFLYLLASSLLVIVLPIMLGSMLAKWLRMRGYEWKLGLIFVTLAIALLSWSAPTTSRNANSACRWASISRAVWC